MLENNIKPEIEVFDTSFIYNAKYYIKKGILKAPAHFQFILGAAGGIAATINNLVYLKSLIPENSTWGALGIGKAHVPIMLATVAMGGHLRVGMEDNVYYGPGVLAKSNSQLVKRATDIVKIAGNDIATVEDVREIFKLTK